MNIGLLTDKYPPDVGGLAVSTRRLAQALARAGHAVCVSLPAPSVAPGAVACADDNGVSVYRVGPYRRADDTQAGWFDHVVALHAGRRWDVIHALYIASPAFVAVSAARYLALPSVISARGNDLDRAAFDPGKFSQIVWSLQHATAVTAVTNDLVRKARALAPGCAPVWLPNGVDTALFSLRPRDVQLAESLGLDNAPVIAFVGEARQKKGLTILLPALQSAARACAPNAPPALLLIGGVRPDEQPVIEIFRRQNPSLTVRVVPNMPHDQLPAYYNLADVLVLPSLHDGLPNALLEGMACERAIVASRVGGMPDAVRDGENGVLVPPGDVNALADAIVQVLADPARRARLGRAARATVESDFTPERELQRNLDIYQHLKRET